jgi:hypothetical protein
MNGLHEHCPELVVIAMLCGLMALAMVLATVSEVMAGCPC